MESSRRMDAPRLPLTQEPVPDAGSFGVRQAGGVLERAQRIADTLREQAEYENDADECLSAFAAQAEDRGARFGFLRTAAPLQQWLDQGGGA